MQELLIYIHRINPRVEFIFRHLFTRNAGQPIRLCEQAEILIAYKGPKFSYGLESFPGILHFSSAPLLFEDEIKEINTGFFIHNQMPALFPLTGESALPYDPFAAAFYLISRYEEYLPFKEDAWHRFAPELSIAHKHDFMEKPVVEIWMQEVMDILQKHFPVLKPEAPAYRFIPTVDIDMAWAYRHKGFLRTLGAFTRDLLFGNYAELKARVSTLRKQADDPYFTFDYLDQLEQQFKIQHLYFILLGRHGKYDKNIRASHPAMRQLVQRLKARSPIGIHPSYASNFHAGKVVQELKYLGKLSGKAISQSRQHYLLISFPETLRKLHDIGICEDYTLGYTSAPGFRAGTCKPYPFYDLVLESETALICYPLILMDAGLQYYLKLPPDEAITKAAELIETVKKYQGTMVTLFHNNSLSEQNEWAGWRKVYETVLAMASA